MTLIEEAESLILHQFAKSPKIKALVRCLVKPFQEVLDVMESLHHGGYIKHASSHRLDVLGEIVGQPRRDMNDDDYRAWIDVGIKLNDCVGTAEDIFAILACSTVHLRECSYMNTNPMRWSLRCLHNLRHHLQ